MPRDQYEQNEFVMDSYLNNLIKEAENAFYMLKDIADEFEGVAKRNHYTDNEDDNQYSDDFAPMSADEEAYYGRRNGRGKCGCGCEEHSHSQYYPCKCRECDKLKEKAHTHLLLGLNDLKSAFAILELAKSKFDDAVDSLQDADKYVDKARCCLKRYDCKYYC